MNHRFRNVVIILLLAAGILVPVWLWVRPLVTGSADHQMTPRSTPISGKLTIALESSLLDVAKVQSRRFSEVYPGATLALSSSSPSPMLQLLGRQAGAVLVEGQLTSQEDSVLTVLKRPVSRQPVARNALVFVVNRTNTVRSLSVEELTAIFSGRMTDWGAVGGQPGRIVPCLDSSNQRLPLLLSQQLFGKQQLIAASAESDIQRLLDRVRDDRNTLAIMTLPVWARVVRTGAWAASIRALPVRAHEKEAAFEATPETLYSGDYPLSATVYYLYDPYDPLATGFGAWLAKEGQKLFERGDMAPYEQLVRSIILK